MWDGDREGGNGGSYEDGSRDCQVTRPGERVPIPCALGKEPSELRSEPRDRLKIVHFRVDLGLSWMEEHMAAHAVAFAFAAVLFHSVRASAAARFLRRLGLRLCFQMRRARFMRS